MLSSLLTMASMDSQLVSDSETRKLFAFPLKFTLRFTGMSIVIGDEKVSSRLNVPLFVYDYDRVLLSA